MNYNAARLGDCVKFTPVEPNPAPLRHEHPGTINDIIPHSTYLLIDWYNRAGTRAEQAVYEAADLTSISREEYEELTARVLELDKRNGVPPAIASQMQRDPHRPPASD